jgi:hypothetical protein
MAIFEQLLSAHNKVHRFRVLCAFVRPTILRIMPSRVISFLIAAVAAYFWWYVMAPLLERLFGVHEPLSFKLRKRSTTKLSTIQRVFLDGVLNFGMGLFIFTNIGLYLKCRLETCHWESPGGRDFLAYAFIYLIGGGLFGLFGAGQDSTT